MCLAIPGRIVRITEGSGLQRTGLVDTGGVECRVNLAMVPEAAVGDHVVTHSGFALRITDEPRPDDFGIIIH
jgi:hydrogenase expression/formation protein HypC